MNYRLLIPILLAGALTQTQALAQDTMKGRLAPVPVDAKSRPLTGGFGTVSATLAGARLTVSGNFTEFVSPATVGQLHESKVTGIRGPIIGDLTISKGATNGTIAGTFTLTAPQVDAFKKGALYVQIHSEKAPEGNVWGWLLK